MPILKQAAEPPAKTKVSTPPQTIPSNNSTTCRYSRSSTRPFSGVKRINAQVENGRTGGSCFEVGQEGGRYPGFAGVEVELLTTEPGGLAPDGNVLACCGGFSWGGGIYWRDLVGRKKGGLVVRRGLFVVGLYRSAGQKRELHLQSIWN